MSDVLWSSPEQVARVPVTVVVLYVAIFVLVRIAGRRTLAELSAYDVLVTIAIGSIVANASLPSKATVADAVAAVATLLALQVTIGALRLRMPRLRRLLDFQPRRIVHEGKVETSDSPASAQLTRTELEAQLRQAGIAELSDVDLVVLEPSGKLSIFPKGRSGSLTKPFSEDTP